MRKMYYSPCHNRKLDKFLLTLSVLSLEYSVQSRPWHRLGSFGGIPPLPGFFRRITPPPSAFSLSYGPYGIIRTWWKVIRKAVVMLTHSAPSGAVRKQKKNILGLFSSALSQFKKHQPSGNQKIYNSDILQSLILCISEKKSYRFLLTLSLLQVLCAVMG